MKCTCGPHPHIDLTAAYYRYYCSNGSNNRNSGDVSINNKDTNNKIITSCRKKIQKACISHGCFHVTISLPDNIDSNADISKLPIDCLAKATKEIEEDIESLFVPKFLQHVIQQQQPSTSHIDCNNNNNVHDDICDGGLVEVQFPTSTILPAVTHNNSRSTTSATFRGRVAESGDKKESKPEPKLSWEFRRCALGGETANTLLQQGEASTAQTDDICNNRKCSSDAAEGERNDMNIYESCSLMPSWTEALHSVASTITHLLDIPPQLALQEELCECLSSNANNVTNRCQGCNIDLLRVFRYDAVSSPHDNHNNDNYGKNNEPQLMGSSPHSDWGTMTIVWQDNKGGLQTYCHACDVWSDVDASSSTKTDDTTTDECEESSTANKNRSSNRKCSLFVHIGDFLSLATIKSGEGNDCYPMWPSPRHRVLCPAVQCDNNTTVVYDSKASAKDCRRSLVYFVYPPPDVSLDTVQKVVSPIISNNDSFIQSTTTMATDKESTTTEFYNHYSLLHNQSKQSSSLEVGVDTSSTKEMKEDAKEMSSFQAYQTIKNLSLDKVIKDKWNQVQR